MKTSDFRVLFSMSVSTSKPGNMFKYEIERYKSRIWLKLVSQLWSESCLEPSWQLSNIDRFYSTYLCIWYIKHIWCLYVWLNFIVVMVTFWDYDNQRERLTPIIRINIYLLFTQNPILDGCSTVDSTLDFDGIRWYSMVLHGIRWYFAIE